MKLSLRHSLFVTALAALLAATGAARAAGYLDPVVDTSVAGGAAGQLQPFVSITPVYQGNADLDSGGDFSARGVIPAGPPTISAAARAPASPSTTTTSTTRSRVRVRWG